MANPFPLTLGDDPKPGDPAKEPTREEVNANPEGLIARIERTRRYFRLCRRAGPLKYARGLDSKPEEMA